jgi:hypothetical protein
MKSFHKKQPKEIIMCGIGRARDSESDSGYY